MPPAGESDTRKETAARIPGSARSNPAQITFGWPATLLSLKERLSCVDSAVATRHERSPIMTGSQARVYPGPGGRPSSSFGRE